MPTPNIPPVGPIGPTVAAETAVTSTAPKLAALGQSIAPTGAMMEATRTVGAVSPAITGTIVNTGILLGGLFLAYKGIQMVATGKNSFKSNSNTA